MSHDPSRKHFLAKLMGLIAVAGLAPKLLAKSAVPAALTPVVAPVVSLRPDTRAVARRGGVA